MSSAMFKRINWDHIIDYIGLSIIGFAIVNYILWGANFAEMHISFTFLSFPVFIGEILLIVSSFLFLLKRKKKIVSNKRIFTCICLYVLFFLIKAFYGNSLLGPLAFRHAALFYYPLFIILGYEFFNRKFFNHILCFLLLIALLLIIAFFNLNEHWLLSGILCSFIFLHKIKNNLLKAICLVFLLITVPYLDLVQTSRMMMVSNFFAIIFLILSLNYILVSSNRARFVIIACGLVVLMLGFWKFADRNALKTLVYFDKFVEEYEEAKSRLPLREKEREIHGYPVYEEVVLFNPNNDQPAASYKSSAAPQLQPQPLKISGAKVSYDKSILKVSSKKVEDSPRDIGVAYANALFRIFIWEDMVKEFLTHKPVFGFHFGHPLRPRTLQILGWASHRIQHDGWISPHNSYLHILYRGGIVGLLCVIVYLGTLFHLIKNFLIKKNIIGIFLCAMIINWFIAANFLLIFELPQTAIPIWFIFGITLAYFQSENDKSEELS